MPKFVLCLMCFFAIASVSAVEINGAGATFPYPLYSKWFSEYAKINPNVKLNYQPIGSGGGIRQVIAGTVDFGASDIPMSDEEKKQSKVTIAQIPTAIGAIAVVYNLKAVTPGIKLSPETLASLFSGKIKKWNDPSIVALNPGIIIPDKDVLVVHRADSSGTTAVFTEYLAGISPAWKTSVGAGKAVNWPVGIGSKGNDGVTANVAQIEGAIGYIELAYAINNKLSMVALKNKFGKFVLPSTLTASKSIQNSNGAGAYPISSLTFILVAETKEKNEKKTELIKFLKWALTKGQVMMAQLHYASLPASLKKAALQKVDSL